MERTAKFVRPADEIKFPHATQAAETTRKYHPLGTQKWSTKTAYRECRCRSV